MCMPTEKVLVAKEAPRVESCLSNIDCSNKVFLQTMMVSLRRERYRQVRVLMDPGSQRSYVRKDTPRVQEVRAHCRIRVDSWTVWKRNDQTSTPFSL